MRPVRIILFTPLLLLGPTLQVASPICRGVYLNPYATGSRAYMESILEHLGSEINTVVVDMKLDSGVIPYRSEVAMAKRIGATKPIIRDLDGIMSKLKERGLYVIARLICFKDEKAATYEDGKFAVQNPEGEVWVDGNGEIWVDPFCVPIWDYNLKIAEELALLGFDEIQFDYLRFPTEGDVHNCVYPHRKKGEKREQAIQGFLREARRRLAPLGVRIGVDVFGFTAWKESLPLEGQDLELIGEYADAVYPMLYPSHFGSFMSELKPEERDYKLVYESTRITKERLSGTGTDLIVYIQGFNWKAPGFGPDYIRNQIEAALRGGSSGWIVWHSASDYEATWEALAQPIPLLKRRPLKVRFGEAEGSR